MGPIYLDNAATSFPKPPAVAEAMAHYLNDVGRGCGRIRPPASPSPARAA